MQNEIQNIEKLFKALGREKRMRILNHLMRHKEATVTEIACSLRMPVPTVSRHLSILNESELLGRRQAVNEVYYSIRFGKSWNKRIFLFALIKNAYDVEALKDTAEGFINPIFFDPYSELLKYVKGQ